MHQKINNSGRIFDLIKNTAFFIWGALLDFVFPPYCMLCGRPVGNDTRCVCDDCMPGLPRLSRPCIDAFDMDSPDTLLFYFEHTISAFEYHNSVRHLVHLFKYKRATMISNFLGKELCHVLALTGHDYDIIVPVPLHPRRRRKRGYNQSQLLADRISREYRLPVAAKELIRNRNTTSQAKQDRKTRIYNLRGAFSAPHPERIAGKRVLLIDDVVTTGATVNECAKVLKQAGAASIDVLSVARVQKYKHGCK